MRRENKELKQRLRDYKYQLAVKKEKLKEIADNLFGQKMQEMLEAEREIQKLADGETSEDEDDTYLGVYEGKTLDQVLQE